MNLSYRNRRAQVNDMSVRAVKRDSPQAPRSHNERGEDSRWFNTLYYKGVDNILSKPKPTDKHP
jgi:hypothetical protein